MSRTRRRRVVAWVLAVLGAFATGAVAMWMLTSSNSVSLSGSGGGPAGQGETSFAIAGDLSEPVSPGVLVPLDLSFANTYDEPMIVSGLVVVVESVDAPHATASLPCDTDDFVVEQLDRGVLVRVEAGETRTFTQLDLAPDDWPRVGMVDADANQDGCKGATLALSYSATGRFDS